VFAWHSLAQHEYDVNGSECQASTRQVEKRDLMKIGEAASGVTGW